MNYLIFLVCLNRFMISCVWLLLTNSWTFSTWEVMVNSMKMSKYWSFQLSRKRCKFSPRSSATSKNINFTKILWEKLDCSKLIYAYSKMTSDQIFKMSSWGSTLQLATKKCKSFTEIGKRTLLNSRMIVWLRLRSSNMNTKNKWSYLMLSLIVL